MNLLHKSRSLVITLLSLKTLISLSIHSIHAFLGLPLPLIPGTFIFLQANTQSSSSLRSTCPNHLNRPLLTTSKTSSTPSRNIISSALILSRSETPNSQPLPAGYHRPPSLPKLHYHTTTHSAHMPIEFSFQFYRDTPFC